MPLRRLPDIDAALEQFQRLYPQPTYSGPADLLDVIDRDALVESCVTAFPVLRLTRPPVTPDDCLDWFQLTARRIRLDGLRVVIETSIPDGPTIPRYAAEMVRSVIYAVMCVAEATGQLPEGGGD